MSSKMRRPAASARGRDTPLPVSAPKHAPEATCALRIGSYNVRVDHHEHRGTIHDWPVRRRPVASAIHPLGADLVALQEPSPLQVGDLEAALGPEWGVHATVCDPDAWAAAETAEGPSDGQARDGNGVVWRRARLELLETSAFWLCPTPDSPPDMPAWGGSPYRRTCHVSRFRDLNSGLQITLFSVHFDHAGDDSRETGGSEARRMSAALVMARASAAAASSDVVVVAGDFNTFEDRAGATYAELYAAADGRLRDVRDAPGVLEVDCGRGSASWEGWETNEWNRANAGAQRYDQIFVSAHVSVSRTAVAEERYVVRWSGEDHWVYASDHLPLVADLALPLSARGARSRARRSAAAGSAAGGAAARPALSPRATGCMVILILVGLTFVGILLFLLWDMLGGTDLECRMQCRHRRFDPPFDPPNVSCALALPYEEVASGLAEEGDGPAAAGAEVPSAALGE